MQKSSLLIKRSLSINGHATSLALEQPFWQELETLAKIKNISLSKLISQIDEQAIEERTNRHNLSAYCRLYIINHLKQNQMRDAQDDIDDAAKIGFIWPDIKGVLHKIDEEVGELKQEIENQDKQAVIDEWGDVVFSLIAFASMYDFDAETGLAQSVRKFNDRFAIVMKMLSEEGKDAKQLSLDEWESYWKLAKKKHK